LVNSTKGLWGEPGILPVPKAKPKKKEALKSEDPKGKGKRWKKRMTVFPVPAEETSTTSQLDEEPTTDEVQDSDGTKGAESNTDTTSQLDMTIDSMLSEDDDVVVGPAGPFSDDASNDTDKEHDARTSDSWTQAKPNKRSKSHAQKGTSHWEPRNELQGEPDERNSTDGFSDMTAERYDASTTQAGSRLPSEYSKFSAMRIQRMWKSPPMPEHYIPFAEDPHVRAFNVKYQDLTNRQLEDEMQGCRNSERVRLMAQAAARMPAVSISFHVFPMNGSEGKKVLSNGKLSYPTRGMIDSWMPSPKERQNELISGIPVNLSSSQGRMYQFPSHYRPVVIDTEALRMLDLMSYIEPENSSSLRMVNRLYLITHEPCLHKRQEIDWILTGRGEHPPKYMLHPYIDRRFQNRTTHI
jgi:hypothetical protein